MTTVALRLLIAGWIAVMLVRAARAAWRQRELTRTVWRRIRGRHVVGAVGLLVVVGSVATALLSEVPGMGWGLGSLVGTTGNAVFLPLEEAAARAGPVPASGPDWVLVGLATVFLGGLALLFPWLAFVEEEVFRAGLEDASRRREVGTALVFGLAHLTMLVPLGAALAVGVAGFVYGRAYRRAYARHTGEDVPRAVLAAYRPTRRATAAAARSRPVPRTVLQVGTGPGAGPAVAGTAATVTAVADDPSRRQAAAVLAATVWHTAFNTTVVVVVWAAIVVTAIAP